MSKTFAAVAVAIGLAAGLAAPAAAQVAEFTPSERSERIVRNLETAITDGQRVVAIAQPILADPALMNAPTAEAFAAQVELRRPQIVAARAEIQRIRARLEALPLLARPSDPSELRGSEQSITSAVSTVGKIDALLGDVLGVADGLAEGNRAKAMRSLVSLAAGSIVMMESQGESLRAQANLIPADGSSHAQLQAMACLSDGVVGLQVSLMGTAEPERTVVRLREANLCISRYTEQSRRALTRESREPMSPHIAAVRDRMALLTVKILDQLDLAAASLSTAATATEAGNGQQASTEGIRQLQEITYRITGITQQQAQVQAGQFN